MRRSYDAINIRLEIAGVKVICLLPYGLKGYKLHGMAVKRLAESQTLIISGFPESVPATPINYSNCQLNNDWARLKSVGQSVDESPKIDFVPNLNALNLSRN